MRKVFKVLILLSLFPGLNMSCRQVGQKKKIEINKNSPTKVLNQPSNDSKLIKKINLLINITYDKPKEVIRQPDSFIKQIKTPPISPVGQKDYTLLLLNIGYVLREHGNILASVSFYEQAYDYYLKNDLQEPDFILYIAKPLANLYTRIDDIQKSITLQEKAIAIAVKNKQWEYLPSIYNNMSVAWQTNGNYENALNACRKGLSYIHSKSIYKPLLYISLSNAFLKLEKADSADYYNSQALKLFQSFHLNSEKLIWYASALKLESDIAHSKGNDAAAIKNLNKAIQIIQTNFPNSKQRVKAKYLLARGKIEMADQPEKAISDFQSALRLMEQDTRTMYISDYTYTDVLYGLAKTFTPTNIDSALYYYNRTIDNDYLTQELIVSKASNYKNSLWNREILSEYAALIEKSRQSSKEDAVKQSLALRLFWAIEMSKGRQIQREINRSKEWANKKTNTNEYRLRSHLEVLHRRLAVAKDSALIRDFKKEISEFRFQFQISEKYFEQTFQRIDFDKFKAFILKKSASQTLASYFFEDKGLCYFISIHKEEAKVYTINSAQLNALKLPQFIADYFGNTPYLFENNPKLYATRANKIAGSLFPFINSAAKNLIISPDEQLYKLPIDALMVHKKFLVESHTLSYTYSFLLNFMYQSRMKYDSKVQFFAKSKYKGQLSNLKFVNEEEKLIANRYKGKLFKDQQATISSFLSQLHNNDILHLATHAVSEPKPYIVLDQPLTLGSLSILNIQSPLIVLSSCESADGKLIKAEGLESLNKAFISKGVKGVIAAQWPVDDQSAATLMGLFYQELYRLNNPAKALTAAKRSFIRKEGQVYRNPWYWASMNYMGLETKIEIKKKTPPTILISVLVLMGIGGICLYYLRRR